MSNGEKCQCCGEEGNDRRTLWMACFFQMEELSIPFEQVEITGVPRKQIGSEIESLSGMDFKVPVFEQSEHNEEPRKFRFYTLRVCKDCRANWMGVIQDWFQGKQNEV